MARGLGELVVRLGLDAAEFTSGLTKAERQAQQFARNFSNEIAAGVLKAEIAFKLLGDAITIAARAFPDLIGQAGHFQDLAEKTGASAEALSSFSISAQVAGSNIDEVANFSIKLSKNLALVDDETSNAGAALKALGIPIKEFKALDPAAQMKELAKALAQFNEIGGGKAAALEALAKGGAQLIPFLKELEQSGGGQITLTKEQIRLADEFADKTARSRAELNAFAQFAATEAAGAISAMTVAAKEFAAELLGIDRNGKSLRDGGAIAEFAKSTALALADVVDVGDAVVRVFKAVGISIGADLAVKSQLLTGNVSGAINTIKLLLSDLDKLAMKEQFSAKLARQLSEQAKTGSLRSQEDRGFDPRTSVNFSGADGKSKAIKELTSDAEQYLKTLEKQLQGTLDLNIVEQAEVAIWELERKSLSGLNEERKASIRDFAAQILAQQEAKKAAQDLQRQEEEESRIRQRISQDTTRRIESIEKEAQHIRDSNYAIQQQIEFLRGGEVGLRAYTDAKLAATIAENLNKEAMLANAGATEAEIKAVHSVTQALQQTQSQLKQLDLAKTFAADKKAAEDFANSISDSFSNAFEGFITGTKSAKDAFKQFAGDIESMLVKLALKNLMNSILGVDSKPDIFSLFAKLLGSIGGSGAGGGIGYGEAGSAIPIGPYPYANGTNWHPGGMALVGERGPELLNLPRGAQVIPLDKMRKRSSVTNVFNVNVMPGATTQSVMQTKAMLRDAVMSSARER